MTGMTASRHARQQWTGWQITVALIAGAVAVGVSPLFFASLFMTVRDLLAPSFGPWPWIVPIATEGSFVVLYLLDILLTLRSKPMGWLRWAPYPFAAGSLTLNVYAGHGHPADAIGHAMVTVAFFLPVLAMEAAVRMLSVSDEEVRLARAMGDARQYAIDLCRSLRGPLWRWRVPALLRRQITGSRFPDEVREMVETCVRVGKSSGWQAAIREWVTGPDALNLAAQAQASSERAVSDIARDVAQPPAETPAETPSQTVSEPVPGTPSQTVAQPVPGARAQTPRRQPSRTGARKPSKAAARRMSATELAPFVRPLLDEDPDLTKTAVMDALHVGRDKAEETLRLAQEGRRQDLVRQVK